MDKKKAKQEALENKRTWGELKKIVLEADKKGSSFVNKKLSKVFVAELLLCMMKDKKDSQYPLTKRFDLKKNKVQINAMGLSICNLLREFA